MYRTGGTPGVVLSVFPAGGFFPLLLDVCVCVLVVVVSGRGCRPWSGRNIFFCLGIGHTDGRSPLSIIVVTKKSVPAFFFFLSIITARELVAQLGWRKNKPCVCN